jgi:hygromycin-B 7''-O-kinase
MAERSLRFTAFVGVKDEADILPRSIAQLRAIGVSTIVVLDFGSTDGTLDDLAEAEAAGDIWILHRDDRRPLGLGRKATVALARASDADFVLFLDADEIVLPQGGSLHDLKDIATADVLSMMRYNVVATDRGPELPGDLAPASYDQVLLYAQPIPDFYRRTLQEPDIPWIQGVLEPKVMVRPRALVDLHPGFHDVDVTAERPWRRAVATDVIIAHVPIRSPDRFAIRAANYGSAIARRPDWYKGFQGWQWVRFAEAAAAGRGEGEYRRQLVDRAELAQLRAALVVRSVREVLEVPLPVVGSEALHRSMVQRAEPWLSATGLVCRAEGIDPGGKLELLDGQARTPAVFIPPGSVVKFHASWGDGHAVADHEAATLRRLAAAGASPPLAVPQLVAAGVLEDTYRYVVMSRVPGTPLRQLEAIEGPAERDEIPAALGGFLQWLHATPVEPAVRADAWPSFVAEVERRRADAVALNRARGLPEHLLAELDGWLPAAGELAGSPSAAVLCHGGLDDSDLLGWLDGRRFIPTGVIDFAHAFVGHPLAELGPIWWSLLGADTRGLEALLNAWDPPGRDEAGFARLALAWALIGGPSAATWPGGATGSDWDAVAERWATAADTMVP